MPIIELLTIINAPAERVFDLACSIDLHQTSMSDHAEKAVAGRLTGLIGLGETVTWEAVHFGLRQRLTSKITIADRPHHLQDVMVSGAFKRFTHDHFITSSGQQTEMRDVFDYTSPMWFLGRIVDFVILKRHMTNLLAARNLVIKQVAESEEWREYLK